MTGQVCMSIERIYVEKEVAAVFKRILLEKIRAIRTGPGLSRDDMDYGPFTGPKQVQIVEDHIADAKAKGAHIEAGGARIQKEGGGVYFQPTLVTGVSHNMKLMTEETFGPIACVMEVNDVEEAIRLANDSEYGLNASVWTRNIDRGIEIAHRIEAGSVCVNDCILTAGVHSLPFGGAKQSGVGTRHGNENGLHVFCQVQSIVVEKRNKPSEMNWFPYQPKTVKQIEMLMKFLYR